MLEQCYQTDDSPPLLLTSGEAEIKYFPFMSSSLGQTKDTRAQMGGPVHPHVDHITLVEERGETNLYQRYRTQYMYNQ